MRTCSFQQNVSYNFTNYLLKLPKSTNKVSIIGIAILGAGCGIAAIALTKGTFLAIGVVAIILIGVSLTLTAVKVFLLIKKFFFPKPSEETGSQQTNPSGKEKDIEKQELEIDLEEPEVQPEKPVDRIKVKVDVESENFEIESEEPADKIEVKADLEPENPEIELKPPKSELINSAVIPAGILKTEVLAIKKEVSEAFSKASLSDQTLLEEKGTQNPTNDVLIIHSESNAYKSAGIAVNSETESTDSEIELKNPKIFFHKKNMNRLADQDKININPLIRKYKKNIKKYRTINKQNIIKNGVFPEEWIERKPKRKKDSKKRTIKKEIPVQELGVCLNSSIGKDSLSNCLKSEADQRASEKNESVDLPIILLPEEKPAILPSDEQTTNALNEGICKEDEQFLDFLNFHEAIPSNFEQTECNNLIESNIKATLPSENLPPIFIKMKSDILNAWGSEVDSEALWLLEIWTTILHPNKEKPPLEIESWKLVKEIKATKKSPDSKTYQIDFKKENQGKSPYVSGTFIMPKSLTINLSLDRNGKKLLDFPNEKLGIKLPLITNFLMKITINDEKVNLSGGINSWFLLNISKTVSEVIDVVEEINWV